MLKALPLAHFLSILLLKEQMIIFVKKKVKMMVRSLQKQLIFSEMCLEISTKPAIFYRLFFGEVRPK